MDFAELFSGQRKLQKHLEQGLLVGNSEWNVFGIRDPSVLVDPAGKAIRQPTGDYVLFYNGRSAPIPNSGVTRIGRAVSRDGIYWQSEPKPVFADQNYACLGSVIQRGTQDYILYYSPDTEIGFDYATSKDGIHWVKNNTGPILTCQSYNIRRMGLPFVTKIDDDWIMVFEGSKRFFNIYAAISEDGLSWTPLNESKPIYTPGSDCWDSLAQANPSLYVQTESKNKRFYLLYNGCAKGSDWDIGILRTDNLYSYSWEACPEPILRRGSSGAWDQGRLEGARLFDGNGTGSCLLFFGLPTNDSYFGGKIACAF